LRIRVIIKYILNKFDVYDKFDRFADI